MDGGASEEFDREVRLAIYRRFVEQGRPPTPIEVALELSTEPAATEASFRRLAEARAIVLAPGTPYVWMANPLSAVPTPFGVVSGGRTWFGNCIWDALGVLAMLGTDGEVRTWCPDCARELRVRVEGGQASSEAEVVHFAVPAAHWWDDIGST